MAGSLDSVPRPVVLVVAIPYLGATVLARLLEQRDRYDVVVPDFAAGEEAPSANFDAVLTTLPVPVDSAPVVIELPWNWDAPVLVTVDDVTEELEATSADPIGEVFDVLDRYVLEGGRSASNRS
ncbi:MAG TPA: hypothetical protein VGR26_00100 [Acidimicrobiales bacterium]|nr:hypothetical protein [Acidimicrobiales bacterium]